MILSGLPDSMPGTQPQPGSILSGCSFFDRCNLAEDKCKNNSPKLEYIDDLDTSVRCFNYKSLKDKKDINSQISKNESNIEENEILNLTDVSISYAKQKLIDQILNKTVDTNPTVKDINININKGETIALVGESGSGKSTILKSIAGLLKTKDGKIRFEKDRDLSSDLKKRNPNDLRAIQLIFQNPDESLNPNHNVEEILSQPLKLYFGLLQEAFYQDETFKYLDYYLSKYDISDVVVCVNDFSLQRRYTDWC